MSSAVGNPFSKNNVQKDIKKLYLNTKAEGSVRVEVLKPKRKKAFKSFDVDSAVSITGDNLSAQAAWKDAKLERLAGRDVCLRFYLDNAAVYSFRFATNLEKE